MRKREKHHIHPETRRAAEKQGINPYYYDKSDIYDEDGNPRQGLPRLVALKDVVPLFGDAVNALRFWTGNYMFKRGRGWVRKSLAEWREELGISQQELATLTEVSVSTVSRWERGVHEVGEKNYNIVTNLIYSRLKE